MVNGCLDGVIRVGFVDVWVTAISKFSTTRGPVVFEPGVRYTGDASGNELYYFL